MIDLSEYSSIISPCLLSEPTLVNPLEHFIDYYVNTADIYCIKPKKKHKYKSQIEFYGFIIHILRRGGMQNKEVIELLNLKGASCIYTRYKRRYLNKVEETARNIRKVKHTLH